MKTRLDVINRAMRRIGVKAEDENLTADQITSVGEVFDALVEELNTEVALTFTSASVPDEVFIPLANLLAVEVAPDYGVSPLSSRGVAFARVLAVLRPDDRAYIAEPEYY
jgi:hypothetical protein